MPPERVPEALDYLAHMLPVFSMFALTLLAAAATATLYMRAVSLRDQRHDGEQSTFTCQPVGELTCEPSSFAKNARFHLRSALATLAAAVDKSLAGFGGHPSMTLACARRSHPKPRASFTRSAFRRPGRSERLAKDGGEGGIRS